MSCFFQAMSTSASGGDAVARLTQIPIREIAASDGAFAGIRTNGTVISWGDERYGGDSRAVESHLRIWDELLAETQKS